MVDHHLPQEGWMECVRHNGEGHLIPGTTLPPPTVLCCRVTVLEGAICILSHLSNHFLTSLEIPEPNHDYVNEGFGLIQGFGLFTLPLAGSGNFTRNFLFFRSWTSSWCHHELSGSLTHSHQQLTPEVRRGLVSFTDPLSE